MDDMVLPERLPDLPGRKRCRKHRELPDARTVNNAATLIEVDVGRCLRLLREEHNLSIRALAEKSDLAVNTLSLIENGKTSPSVGTLQQIAAALAVPITAFFETGQLPQRVIHTRAGFAVGADFHHGTLADLGAGLSNRTIEPFLVTMEPGAESGPDAIVHAGQEFVFCLDGQIAYTIEDQVYLLEPGDSLLFFAILPHRWSNVGDVWSKALLIFCPFGTRDRPDELHFTQTKRISDG